MEEKSHQVSRRHFLETATIAGTVGAFGMGAFLSSCSKKKSLEELGLPLIMDRAPNGPKLKAGLIGTGDRGTGAALNFISAGPNCEVIALADVLEEKIEACRSRFREYNIEFQDDHCFTGFDAYQKLLETDVDVVLLVTPPYFRPEQFRAAIQAKKHVFMEKPLAVDPIGIRSILSTAEKASALGLNVITGTQRRHHQGYIETYKQIANGAIGEITSARAYWNQSHVWFRTRQPGWSDMEYMIRNWNNFIWLSGDHFLDTHIHNIDVINWFAGSHPISAIGYGGRHRRVTGNQYDFFSVDFHFGKGLYSHSMSRQIDNCANGVGEFIIGTEGYTNCENTIYNLDGSEKWTVEYPLDDEGRPATQPKISEYIQEHIHLVTAIRTNTPVNEAKQTAYSNLTAIMGRESAYTGKLITWDEIMNSDLKLGPEKIEMGPVDQTYIVPVPGTAVKSSATTL